VVVSTSNYFHVGGAESAEISRGAAATGRGLSETIHLYRLDERELKQTEEN
jgi:hypothetical protein